MMGRSTKRQKISSTVEAAVNGASLPAIVKILATTHMLTIKELGRLIQTSSVIQSIIDDDEVWKSLLNQMEYGISSEIVGALGHKWLIKQAIMNNQTLNTPATSSDLPPIPPPRLSDDDMMIIYEIGYTRPDGVRKVSHGSVTGHKLEELWMTDNLSLPLANPVVIGDTALHDDDYGEFRIVSISPHWWGEEDNHLLTLKAHLVRIPDREMCCLFNNEKGTEFEVEEWIEIPQPDETIDDNNWSPGEVLIEDVSQANIDSDEDDTVLRIRDSPMGFEIMSRYQRGLYFVGSLSFGLIPDEGKVQIIGGRLNARKLVSHRYFNWRDFSWNPGENNGVTVAHILSELACS